MPVTRIKNNQITDATVNLGTKAVNFSLTAGKIANNLTYGSSLTISGDLTVNGTTTTINSTTASVTDPIMELNEGASGSNSVDVGLYIERGSDTSHFMGWDESADQFAFVATDSAATATAVNITDYAAVRLGALTADDTITATGNVSGGNLVTSAKMDSATIHTSGLATLHSATVEDLTDDQVVVATTGGRLANTSKLTFNETTLAVTGAITASTTAVVTGNITGGNLITAALMDSATIHTSGLATLHSATVEDLTNDQVVVATTGGRLANTNKLTFDESTLAVTGAITASTTVTATANVIGGNLVTAGKITDGALVSNSGTITGAVAITASGAITGGSLTDGTATLSSGSLTGAVNVTASGTVTGGTLAGTLSTAAQTNVTSLGTLTALQVDNVNINANTISTTNSNGNLILAPNGTGGIEANDTTIGDVADPAGDKDVVTLGYLNSQLSGAANTIVEGDSEITVRDNLSNQDIIAKVNDTTVLTMTQTSITSAVNMVVTGTLTVNGTTTTVNSTTMTVDDPILTLGGDSAPGSDDNKDRGVEFRYHDGSSARVGFFGFDDSTGKFTFLTAATNSSEVFSGTKGAIDIGDIAASGAAVVTGNITGGNLITAALMDSATIHTSGLATLHSATVEDLTNDQVVVATTGGRLANTNKLTFNETTLAVTGAITASTTITGSGNVTGQNLVTAGVADSATIHTSGLATLHSATVEDLTDDQVVVATTGGRLANTSKLTFNETTLAVTGAITASTTITATANVVGGNLTTGAQVVATGNITGGNLITAALMDSATIHTSGLATLAQATVEDLTDDQVVVATTGGRLANTSKLTFDESTLAVTGAITASTTITATANVIGGNLVTAGKITDGAFVSDSGAITGVTTLTVDQLVINGRDISPASGEITINDASNDVDFRVESNGVDDMLFVDGGNDAVLIGGQTADYTTDVPFKVVDTGASMLSMGTTGQRPSTGVKGMIRYNTTTDALEIYNGAWAALGESNFTVIATQNFSGDNSTVAFTLSENQTTASCLVSINGVVQLPTTAYAVSNTTLTFTEAPASGDTIEVRKFTTTTTVKSLENADASAKIAVADGSTAVTITGVPNLASITKTGSNGTGNIGQSDNAFNTIHGKSTSSEYADLAERYLADEEYEIGTVISIGGEQEVTMCDEDMSTKVLGTVSENPAVIMNNQIQGDNIVSVALTGRVPVKVTGPVNKGDMLVSAGDGKARAEADPKIGSVIGKSLENFEGGDGVIEAVVGKH
jgi:small nuclear ribonucleoprotein (snRNP)-like protein